MHNFLMVDLNIYRKICSPGRNQHGWIKGHIFLYMSAGGKAPNLSFIFPASPTSGDKADERGCGNYCFSDNLPEN